MIFCLARLKSSICFFFFFSFAYLMKWFFDIFNTKSLICIYLFLLLSCLIKYLFYQKLGFILFFLCYHNLIRVFNLSSICYNIILFLVLLL